MPDLIWNASFSHNQHIQISTHLSPQLGNLQPNDAIDICSTAERKQGSLVEMGEDSGGAPVKQNIHVNLDIAYTSKGYGLKAGYVIFQKRFRKLSWGRVPKQTCSQSAVRGVSTHDMEERAFSEQPSRATER